MPQHATQADRLPDPTSLEDWAFLLKAGKMEVSKLEALLLLFSLCLDQNRSVGQEAWSVVMKGSKNALGTQRLNNCLDLLNMCASSHQSGPNKCPFLVQDPLPLAPVSLVTRSSFAVQGAHEKMPNPSDVSVYQSAFQPKTVGVLEQKHARVPRTVRVPYGNT